MNLQGDKPAWFRTRARGRARAAAVVGVLTLLAGAVGVRSVGSPAQAASVADLAQLRDQAVAVLDRLQLKGSTGYSVGIDPSRQRIGVYLFRAPGAPAPDLVGLRASLGAEADLHTVTGTPQLQARIRSGEPLAMPGGRECTTGFAVALRDGRQGFLTAGHCFDTTRPANQQHGYTHDGLPMTGLEYKSVPSDWGILTLDNTTDEAAAEVSAGGEVHPVRAVAAPTDDMPICKSGIATDTTCGKITLRDAELVTDPVRDANGVVIVPSKRIKGLIQNSVCTEHADSGAPVYTDPAAGVHNAPVDAVGIVIGGDTETDATGAAVCLERLYGPGTSISFALPLGNQSDPLLTWGVLVGLGVCRCWRPGFDHV
jgi:streptogrisin C